MNISIEIGPDLRTVLIWFGVIIFLCVVIGGILKRNP